jgi:hypothetical protein
MDEAFLDGAQASVYLVRGDDPTGQATLVGKAKVTAKAGPNGDNWQATVPVAIDDLQLFPTTYTLFTILNEQPDETATYRPAPVQSSASPAFTVAYAVSGQVGDQNGNVLSGWTVFLDLNRNGVRDAGEPARITNASGFYGFADSQIPAGTTAFDVRLVPLASDYDLPGNPVPIPQYVTGQSYTANFTAKEHSAIRGTLFDDVAASGKSVGQPGHVGATVYIDANRNGHRDPGEPVTVTGNDGGYVFSNLQPGTYHVEFTKPSGFNFTGADLCPDDKDSDANSSGVAPNVTLASGETNLTIDAGLVAIPPPPPPGNGATRTIGYWGSHLAALTAAVNAGAIDLGILAVVPSGTQDLNDATIGEAEAIMHGKIGGRSDLGQARMQLGQQLVGAFANVGFLGTTTQSKGFSATLLQDAVAALDSTNVDLIKSFIGQVDAFNNSGDSVNAPSLAQFGSADPKAAKAAANKTGSTIDPGPAFK